MEISIHAPARGATLFRRPRQIYRKHFNPRSREGSDGRILRYCGLIMNFNPRSREGSDIIQTPKTDIPKTFQSTLPRGERLLLTSFIEQCNQFQSTLPRGERLLGQIYFLPLLPISIHAPARGATRRSWTVCLPGMYFNPRSREGSDLSKLAACNTALYFNPRSREGSDLIPSNYERGFSYISIHAPARGATFDYLDSLMRG